MNTNSVRRDYARMLTEGYEALSIGGLDAFSIFPTGNFVVSRRVEPLGVLYSEYSTRRPIEDLSQDVSNLSGDMRKIGWTMRAYFSKIDPNLNLPDEWSYPVEIGPLQGERTDELAALGRNV